MGKLVVAAALAVAAVLSGAGAAGATEAGAAPAGNVNVGRVLQANELVAGSLLAVDVTVSGSLDVRGEAAFNVVKARTVVADVLTTGSLQSPSGTIIVDGDLIITNSRPARAAGAAAAAAGGAAGGATQNADTKPDVRAASFLAEDVVVGGVPQWRLVRHDDFQAGAQGWSLAETSSCAGAPAGDRFLGGHCRLGADSQARKTYAHLPPHSQVRVAARYHFIDNWQGETAFLKLGEQVVWADRHHAPAEGLGLHMCGSDKHAESRISAPVDVTLPHSASLLEVAFGSTGKAGEDPCDRSFGVDDVMVYVR